MKRFLLIAALILFPPLTANAGTLVIEEWASIGTQDKPDAPIFNGNTFITTDATTSATDETVTTQGATRYLYIQSTSGAHRITINSTTVNTSIHLRVEEGKDRVVAIRGGQSYAYDTP